MGRTEDDRGSEQVRQFIKTEQGKSFPGTKCYRRKVKNQLTGTNKWAGLFSCAGERIDWTWMSRRCVKVEARARQRWAQPSWKPAGKRRNQTSKSQHVPIPRTGFRSMIMVCLRSWFRVYTFLKLFQRFSHDSSRDQSSNTRNIS